MDNYIRAVERAGGAPVPGYAPEPDPGCLGLVLCGGGDLDPAWFGQEDRGSHPPDPRRDAAELELVRLNLQELSKAGKARSATYTMLTGSRFMLEEMQKRLDEPASDVAGRLNALKRQLEPEDDGFRDVE